MYAIRRLNLQNDGLAIFQDDFGRLKHEAAGIDLDNLGLA